MNIYYNLFQKLNIENIFIILQIFSNLNHSPQVETVPGPVSVPGVRLRVAVVPGLRPGRPHLPQHRLRDLRRGGHQLRRTLPLLAVRYLP